MPYGGDPYGTQDYSGWGTPYTQVLAASLTFSGALGRAIVRSVVAALSTTASIARTTVRALVAALSPTGSASRLAVRALAASLSPTAVVTKGLGRLLAGALSSAGSMARSVTLSLSATWTSAGSVQRQVAVSLGGSVTFAGAFGRAFVQNLSATLSWVGNLLAGNSRPVSSPTKAVGAQGNTQVLVVEPGTNRIFDASEGLQLGVWVSATIPDFIIKQGDTGPNLVHVLEDSGSNAVDLTGCSVAFHMTDSNRNLVISRAATIDQNGANFKGQVHLAWQSSDTANVGLFYAEWQVTFPSGALETFPNNRDLFIRIVPQLG